MPPGTGVLVACSGGGDSVALAALLCELERETDWLVAGLLHVNHGLRGPSADADEEFCQQLARDLSVPIIVERVDVAARARAEGTSVELPDTGSVTSCSSAWRRMEQPISWRPRTRATTGGDGSVAIDPRRRTGRSGRHPAAHRAGRAAAARRPAVQLRDYLRWRGLSHREDPSNRDERVLRNRVRHRLIPFLASISHPQSPMCWHAARQSQGMTLTGSMRRRTRPRWRSSNVQRDVSMSMPTRSPRRRRRLPGASPGMSWSGPETGGSASVTWSVFCGWGCGWRNARLG